MIKYRVILKVSYYEMFFEFDTPTEATAFAEVALEHMVSSEDVKKPTSIILKIVDVEAEKRQEQEEQDDE